MELRGAQVTTGGRCNSRAYAPGVFIFYCYVCVCVCLLLVRAKAKIRYG